MGYERRPGVGGFVRHLCYDAAQQLLRTVLLVVLRGPKTVQRQMVLREEINKHLAGPFWDLSRRTILGLTSMQVGID